MPFATSASCTRRQFLAWSALAAGGTALAGCLDDSTGLPGGRGDARSVLASRPILAPTVPRGALAPGVRVLTAPATPEVLLYVPTGYSPAKPAPLAVTLHGAGQSNRTGIAPLQAQADASGMLLVSPQSVGTTWDFIYGQYGADVAALDAALGQVFRDCNVDPAHIALTGFSDGASYALSLGLTNGDLFTRLVAFSPGLMAPAAYRGKPPVFVSHGTRDQILPIDATSRRIVPSLRDAGYQLTYREFDGPHAVPADIARRIASDATPSEIRAP
jgi:predicted esterase